jgi:energy-coupling factor transporter ATP-binding protein EcfA2
VLEEIIKFKHMFVKLSKFESDYKKPVERDWPNVNVTFEEANSWVSDGWGVGINIQKAGIKVIDIDHELTDIEVEILRQTGGLVMKTPRGWQVFAGELGFNEDFKNVDIKVQYIHELSGEVGWYELRNVEIYTGASTRQVVLPVFGTIRHKLGGRVVYFDGKKYEGGHTLLDIYNIISEARDKEIYIRLKNLPESSDFVYNSRGFKSLFSNWRDVSPEEVLEFAKKLKKGERHNKMLTLMMLWVARGFEDDERYRGKLIEVLRDVTFADEKHLRSTQNEIDAAWEGALEKGEELKRNVIKTKKGRPGKALKIIDEYFADASYIKEFDDLYILHDKWAIPADKMGDYLSKLGVAVSDNVAKQVVAYIYGNNFENKNARIAVDYVQRAGDELYIAANYNGKSGIFIYNEESGFIFKENAENFYIRYGVALREFKEEDFKGAIEYFDKVLKVVLDVNSSAYSAIIAPFIVGNCRGGIIIQGASGSGKSSFSKLIQKVSQGVSGWISVKDDREIMANMANSRMIGIDENETLQKDIQEKLKSAISYGEMQVRKLFTNKELDKIKASASVILSAVEVRDLQPDMLRRSVVFTMKPKNNKISEDSFDRAVTNAMNKLLIGAIEIAGIIKDNEIDLLQLLSEGDKEVQELPAWLRDTSKIDIAKSYWHACLRLGISEEEAKRVWREVRGGVHGLALDAWEDVLKEIDTNTEFAEKMRNGAKLSDISNVIIKDDITISPEMLKDERNKFANKLKNTALKVAPLLSELGFNLNFDTIRERGKRVRIYYLSKGNEKQNEKQNGIFNFNEDCDMPYPKDCPF